jgi:protein-S-isoprenylcysteine O-methyltransferase Ste14
MSHGSKITKVISGGKYVEPWKRFPIFFGAIIIVFTIKHYLELYFKTSFDEHQINVVFVIFWLIALFAIYYLIFTKQHEEEERKLRKSGPRKR